MPQVLIRHSCPVAAASVACVLCVEGLCLKSTARCVPWPLGGADVALWRAWLKMMGTSFESRVPQIQFIGRIPLCHCGLPVLPCQASRRLGWLWLLFANVVSSPSGALSVKSLGPFKWLFLFPWKTHPKTVTHPPTKMAPVKRYLEDSFPFERSGSLSVAMLVGGRVLGFDKFRDVHEVCSYQRVFPKMNEPQEKAATSTPHAHRMHTACTPHAHRMHTACTPHAHRMHTACTPHERRPLPLT